MTHHSGAHSRGTTTPKEDERRAPPRPFTRRWWKALVRASWTALKDLFRDDGPTWAASIAYYALLSSFPFLLLIALLSSVFIGSEMAVDRIGSLMGDLLPEGEDQIESVVQRAYEGRAVAGVFSVLALLWSGTRVFGAITRALNVAYDEEAYAFVKQFLVQAAMLATIGSMIVLGLLSRSVLDFVWEIRDIPQEERTLLFNLLRSVLPPLLTTLAFFLIYRFVPRHRPTWLPALAGAVIAAGLFWGGRALFLIYVRYAGNYGEIYGPISLVIVLVLWVWICGLILILGGQLVAHYQEILVEGKKPEAVEERHREVHDQRRHPSKAAARGADAGEARQNY